jgi:fimbrial chaperone protein
MQGGCIRSTSEQRRSRRPKRAVRHPVLTWLGVVSLLLLCTAPALAFKISPFSAEMTPSGAGAKLDYTVENETTQATAVQISMVKREQEEDGTEKLLPADDDFLVFPAQLILLPNEKRTVRVQWLGTVSPDRELNLKLRESRDNLQLLVKYQTALYIVPPGVHAIPTRDLVVQRAEPGRNPHGQQTLDVTLANHGLAHIQLRNIQLTATSSGKSVTLAGQRLAGSMLGENVLAGSVRHFSILWPPELGVGTVSVTLETKAAP